MPWQDDPVVSEAKPIKAAWASDPIVGGPQLSPGQPQSDVERAWETVRQAIFGSPERAELRDTGIGLQPTPADMVKTGLAGASFAGGTAAGAAGLARVPGAVGAVGRAVRPMVTLPIAGGVGTAAYKLATGSGLPEAVIEGATTGLAMKGASLAGAASKLPGVAGKVGRLASAVTKPTTAPKATPKAATPARNTPIRKATTAPKAEPKVETPVPKVDRGKAAAAQHKANVDFAREVAKREPKVGEKIHILLDDAGNPVKYLTPDQAGAATRAGKPVTWVRNMFQ